jgi:hypothetical protein
MVQQITQRTGLGLGTVKAIVPLVLPIVMQIFSMGAGSPKVSNGILNGFIDGDNSRDLGEVYKFANRFLNVA